jgi:hypothetical protein
MCGKNLLQYLCCKLYDVDEFVVNINLITCSLWPFSVLSKSFSCYRQTCCSLYDSDATQEWYSPAHSPPNHSYTPTGDNDYRFGDDMTSDYDEYNDSYWQYERDCKRSYGRRLPAPPPDAIDYISSQPNGYCMPDDKEHFASLDHGYENGYSNMGSEYSRYEEYYDGHDDYYDGIDQYPENSRHESFYEDGAYPYDNEPMSIIDNSQLSHYGSIEDPQQTRNDPYYAVTNGQYYDGLTARQQYMGQQITGSPAQSYPDVKEQQAYIGSSVQSYVGGAGQLYVDPAANDQQTNRGFDRRQQVDRTSVDGSMPLTMDKCITDTQRPYIQHANHPRGGDVNYDNQYGLSHELDDALYDDGYVDKAGIYRYDEDRYYSSGSRCVESITSIDAGETEPQKSSFDNDRDQLAYGRYYDAKGGDSFESYDPESAGYSFPGSVNDTALIHMKDSGYQTYDHGLHSTQDSRYFESQPTSYLTSWQDAKQMESSDGRMGDLTVPANLTSQQANSLVVQVTDQFGSENIQQSTSFPEPASGPQLSAEQAQFRGQPTVSVSEAYLPPSSPSALNGSHDVNTGSLLNGTAADKGYLSFY